MKSSFMDRSEAELTLLRGVGLASLTFLERKGVFHPQKHWLWLAIYNQSMGTTTLTYAMEEKCFGVT